MYKSHIWFSSGYQTPYDFCFILHAKYLYLLHQIERAYDKIPRHFTADLYFMLEVEESILKKNDFRIIWFKSTFHFIVKQ